MTQFKQASVTSCASYGEIDVSRNDYPWLNDDQHKIPTFLVSLEDGTDFRFGSIIGLNGTIKKIADSVPAYNSSGTQTALFMGLPLLLNGQPASGISKAENSNLPNSTLFIASRNIRGSAGLIFGVQDKDSASENPIVLRVGIYNNPKQRDKILTVMGVTLIGGKRRQG